MKILSAEEMASVTSSREVYQIDVKTGEILNKFNSFKNAGLAMENKNRAMNISAACRGKQKQHMDIDGHILLTTTVILFRMKKEKKVAQLDKDTKNIIKIFESVADAAEHLSGERENSYSSCIASCARGLFDNAYGYSWRYV